MRRFGRRGLAVLTGAALVAGAGVGYLVVDRFLARDDAPCPTSAAAGLDVAERRTDPGPTRAAPATPAESRPECWPTGWPGEAAGSPTTASTPTPTPTSAPTPAAPAAGPDTTGVPAGVTLAEGAAGTFDDDGLVIDGQHITGDLTLTGDGQVLRNSRVDGHVIVRGAGTVIEDAEVGALSVSGTVGFAARRVEVFGAAGKDGIHVTSGGDTRASDVVIEDSWIHSPKVESKSHYDGIQVRGVDRLTLRGNTIDLGRWAPQYNAALFLEDANGGNHDVLVEGNVLNGGGYSLYLEGTNVSLVDNRFGRDGRWGLLYPEHEAFTASGNTWADSGDAVDLD